MLLEDRGELAAATINSLINFIKEMEVSNCYDHEKMHDAQKIVDTLMNEVFLLKYKLDYLNYGYADEFLDEAV